MSICRKFDKNLHCPGMHTLTLKIILSSSLSWHRDEVSEGKLYFLVGKKGERDRWYRSKFEERGRKMKELEKNGSAEEGNGRKNLGRKERGNVLSQWRRRLQLQCLNFMRKVKLLLRVPRVVKSPLRFTLHPSPCNIRFTNAARIHGRPSFRPVVPAQLPGRTQRLF